MVSWTESADKAEEIRHLHGALASQPVIEQAKGMMMLVRTCEAEEAFTVLRDVSQRTNVKLHDVAAIVVATGSGAGVAAELAQRVGAKGVEAVRRSVRWRLTSTAFE
ncbi:MAG TPA: ANTAR domain-containing protein [Amycolatopsis sp.]|nr:ANTAR domain-containing protein [Amycolatopsis sp.]